MTARRWWVTGGLLAGFVVSGAAVAVGAAAGTNDDCVDNGIGTFAAGTGTIDVGTTGGPNRVGGQISGAGATLFVDFFLSPTSYNDWIDVDNDGLAGTFTAFPFTDRLATQWTPPNGEADGNVDTWWMFQYRSVGSVNGFNEFVANQTCEAIPISIPGERGIFNLYSYAIGGGLSTDVFPRANASGTPVQPCEVEFAFLDVPSAWAVQVAGEGLCQPGGSPACTTDADCGGGQKCVGGPKWNAKPTQPGYGRNPILSSTGYLSNLQTLSRQCGTCANPPNDACVSQANCDPGNCSVNVAKACRSDQNCNPGTCSVSGASCHQDSECPNQPEVCNGEEGICINIEQCNLAGPDVSLNTTLDDEDTIYDFVGAWVPVAYISNRGTGVQDIKYSQARYLFTTGRMPNGENLVAATRSVGSGTRNAIMNSTGIDTSWGRGDNVGNENPVTGSFNVGPNTQPTNAEGSSQVEQAVITRRLAVGYTGLAGGSRAVVDVRAGLYEILNVCIDVDNEMNPIFDCSPQTCPIGPKECSGGGPGDTCINDAGCPMGEECKEIDAARPNNGYVRPKLDTVLDNCDPRCGYQIGGNGSFVTRGDPHAMTSGNPPLDNTAVRDYLLNLQGAIEDFSEPVNTNQCLVTGNCTVTTATVCRVGHNDDCPAGTCSINGGSCHASSECPDFGTGEVCNGGEVCNAKACANDAACTLKTCEIDGSVCTTTCADAVQTCDASFCSIDGNPCLGPGDCPPVPQDCRIDICRQNLNSGGQFLATTFFLPLGIDCQQSLVDGKDFTTPTNPLNQALQNFIRETSNLGAGGDTPDYGTISPADGGRIPVRNSLSGTGLNYSDGAVTGTWTYWNGAFVTGLSTSARMSVRNKLQGDFNEDGARDINDANEMVKAYHTPRRWQRLDPQATGAGAGAALGTMLADNAIPEVIGDHNGDGSLTKEDLRYFMDGLAMTGGQLNREQGAIAIDTAIAGWGRCADDLTVPCQILAECTERGLAGPCDLSLDYFPWADQANSLYVLGVAVGTDPKFIVPKDVNDAAAPMLATGAAYKLGDFRADVAGGNPTAGAHPIGWDGFINDQDIDYCCRSVRAGHWSDLNEAIYMDLSCDMNGDLDVTSADIDEIVQTILETTAGDVDLDGDIDDDDRNTITASIVSNPCNNDGSCGWADGDTNCDGIVDATDGAVLPAPPGRKNRFIGVSLPPLAQGANRGPGAMTAIRVELRTLNHPRFCCAGQDGNGFGTGCNPNGSCNDDTNCSGGTPLCRPQPGPGAPNACCSDTTGTSCHPLATCTTDANCAGVVGFPECEPMFKATEGKIRYVNSFPGGSLVCEDDGLPFSTSYRCARLGCEPEYRDWATDLTVAVNPPAPDGLLYITGDTVIPSSTFEVSEIPLACGGTPGANVCADVSGPLALSTATWGDITSAAFGPPDGKADVLDIPVVTNKLKGIATGHPVLPFPEYRIWLKQEDPNAHTDAITVVDLSDAQDAVLAKSYPVSRAPDGCPHD